MKNKTREKSQFINSTEIVLRNEIYNSIATKLSKTSMKHIRYLPSCKKFILDFIKFCFESQKMQKYFINDDTRSFSLTDNLSR